MIKEKEAIFALSTPPGKSAIAIFRISGKNAYKIVRSISTNMPLTPNVSTLNTIKTTSGELVDQTITTFFKKPKSYTGENMVEISLHGGNATIDKFIKTINKNKEIRIAEPGEFTKRAFENNKLDLMQAEAIGDLINAETEGQRKQAYSQLRGNFSKKTKELHSSLKSTLANVEAMIDFSDEDLPDNLLKESKEQIENIIVNIEEILHNYNFGKKVRTGFIVAIIGKTNTGKSSFINSISNQEIAIVTKEPGTTRDILESYIDIFGLPVRFFDTAGIRQSKNLIEKIGIKKGKQVSHEADINLVFLKKEDEINDYLETQNAIFIKSKFDKRSKKTKNKKIYDISSKNSYGIKILLKKIHTLLLKKGSLQNETISRERHYICLTNSIKHLKRSNNSKNLDIFAEDIRLALKELSKIYGSVDIEDILDIIFSDFCIGK